MKFLLNFQNFKLDAFGVLVLSLWGIDMCEVSQDVKADSLKATTNPTGFQSLCTVADFEWNSEKSYRTLEISKWVPVEALC